MPVDNGDAGGIHRSMAYCQIFAGTFTYLTEFVNELSVEAIEIYLLGFLSVNDNERITDNKQIGDATNQTVIVGFQRNSPKARNLLI